MVRLSVLSCCSLLACALVLAVETATLPKSRVHDEDYDDFGGKDDEYKCGEECHGLVKISGWLAGGLAILLLITLADPHYGGRRRRSREEEEDHNDGIVTIGPCTR